MIPGLLTRRMRQRCSACGSGVRWFSRAQARRRSGLSDLVAEAEPVIGRIEAVWECVVCGEVGAFGPTETG